VVVKLNLVGCSHHSASVDVRERLAFNGQQVEDALAKLRDRFPRSEAVLLSTCNRVELYTGCTDVDMCPTSDQVVQFMADYHGLSHDEVAEHFTSHAHEDAIRHLFSVAASMDSMVVGEPQILSQVKEAYRIATDGEFTGPLTNGAFQGAIRVAKRVATETTIHKRRVSIPSVAVAEFAKAIFERFDDKFVLVIGAGEMGRETAQYLLDEGASKITVVNRHPQRAAALASEIGGSAADWSELDDLLVKADLVVSTTGATEPIVSLARYQALEPGRYQRPLFLLDLAVPRDFDPAIGECVGVYLYSVDDLRATCEANQKARQQEWPKAHTIIEEETQRFLADWNRRATGPTIQRLRNQANRVKLQELQRLMNKLDGVEGIDAKTQREIEIAFDRLINKVLHPPLESLRDEAKDGAPHGLLEALVHLFKLQD
jgi:glutamyl-tRNA reductase